MFCPKCGMQNADGVSFCQNCGLSLTTSQPADQQPSQAPQYQQAMYGEVPQPNDAGYDAAENYRQQSPNDYTPSQQPMYGHPQQSPVNHSMESMYPAPPQKKGLKWWHIFLIILGVVVALIIVLGIIGAIAGSNNSNSSTGNNNSSGYHNQESEDNKEKIEFTPGAVTDGSYINEWLNIRFEIPEGYPEGGEDFFEDALSENPESAMGYCSLDVLTGKQLSVVFENAAKGVSEKTYLEAIVRSIKSQWSESGVTADWSDVTVRTIAGEQWTTTTAANISTNGNTEVMCIKIIDNKLCTLTMCSDDENEIKTFLDSIRTTK